MSFSKYFAAFSILGTLTLSAPAWADVPPDDDCEESAEGKACHNASVDGSAPIMSGICRKTMCTRMTPDGSMTYECHRCVGDDPQGSGGQSNEGGGNSAGTKSEGGKPAGGSSSGSTAGESSGSTAGKSSGAGTSSTAGTPTEVDDDSEDGGCSVSQAPGGAGALGTGLLALGLAVAGIFRRRSQAS
jgi:MYXO-CTERM domain-containing protein